MRKLKRSIAKANMREKGLWKMFKKNPASKGEKRQSYFAQNWRRYC